MFSLTLREQFLVAAVLCALVSGMVIKHWRDARRESVALVSASRPTADFGGVKVP